MNMIVINALSARRGGGQTYIINFLKHLPKGNFRIKLLACTENEKAFEPYLSERVELYVVKWASRGVIYRALWERFTLPGKLKKWNASVYYAPGGVMVTKVPKVCSSVTALRNMLPFDETERKRFPLFSYIRFKLWLLKRVFLKSYKMADKVVFISNYSLRQVEKYIPGIDKKSCVIPHGLNELFLKGNSDYELPDYLEKGQFYLYVSILDVYKAQKEVVKAWEILSEKGFCYPLVLAGPKYNAYGEAVCEQIEDKKLEGKVYYLGKVDYEKLPGLYKSARGLVFASSCECCPNILLEKLSAGKTVFCSNYQPMPEFGQDAVTYFDPYNPQDLAEKVFSLELSPSQLDKMGHRAYKQALKFDWNITIKKTFDFLN